MVTVHFLEGQPIIGLEARVSTASLMALRGTGLSAVMLGEKNKSKERSQNLKFRAPSCPIVRQDLIN